MFYSKKLIDSIFDDAFTLMSSCSAGRLPYQTKTEADRHVIEVPLPGTKKERIDVETKDKVLTVSVRNEDGEVVRSSKFVLPPSTEASQVRASYEDGLLVINVYRKEAPQATKILIT